MMDTINGKKLNKGEWAEFYVMLKLLGEGRLYTANKLLMKNYQSYLDVLKIIRQECETQVLEYIINRESGEVVIKPQGIDSVLATVSISDFSRYAKELFDGIKIDGLSVFEDWEEIQVWPDWKKVQYVLLYINFKDDIDKGKEFINCLTSDKLEDAGLKPYKGKIDKDYMLTLLNSTGKFDIKLESPYKDNAYD